MRRADRLFQIIQILRRSTRPVTAARIAEELEVSRRTVYRDIADLVGQRVPIVGEAGFGFLLDPSYDMPPLMLTPDEIEAVVLGAQWVAGRGDPTLARAAQDLMSKIVTAVPEKLRPFVLAPSVGTPPARIQPPEPIDLDDLRQAIRDGRKLHLHYRSAEGAVTERKVWPVVLGYGEASRVIAAWCELRQDFRYFRTDRLVSATVLDEPNGLRRGELRRRWMSRRATENNPPRQGGAGSWAGADRRVSGKTAITA